MRLKHIFISEYKNLKDFTLTLEGNDFIDFFVGKNGSGKSNLLEALIVIFKHLYEQSSHDFDFKIAYEIDDKRHEIEWRDNLFYLNGNEKGQKSFTTIPLPENVLIYYSGHNDTITKIVRHYETEFRDRIKGANPDEARHFIGIGTEYKSLLLSTLLLQPDANIAKQFIKQKLTISAVSPTLSLVLKRPKYADGRFKELTKLHETDITAIDHFDPRTHFWGADGITRDFLESAVNCIKGESAHQNIYNSDDDQYLIPVDVALFQERFKDTEITEQFRLLDNLKTLGMLASIEVALTIQGNQPATLNHFSDGQFQSVYIYAVTELFKDKECITLLDEPDSFLHPEWQFEFLKQVFQISDEAAKTNHILLSSHSASTIANVDESAINLFDLDGQKVVVNRVKKSDVVKSLSAGLISFSENEARLNINHVLKNTTGPILFTEGITDEIILEIAWDKLYPATPRPFEIQNAFSCGFLRNLIKDQNLYQNHPGRTFFSLYDFDEAYNDWKQLGDDIETDPHKCLAKKHRTHESYAILLPVPTDDPLKSQVINPHTGTTYGNKSLLTIEHLFYGVDGLDDYFVADTNRTDNFIKFISDGQKVTFAKEVVPSLDKEAFEPFKAIFDIVQSNIPEEVPIAANS